MKLRIQLLRQGDAVRDRLQRDGWRLKAEGTDTLSACHAAVHSQAAARRPLHGLGLLTSASLRIEFPLIPLRRWAGGLHRARFVGRSCLFAAGNGARGWVEGR
jgi:hypothetical protein